jgi:hypothetical protein
MTRNRFRDWDRTTATTPLLHLSNPMTTVFDLNHEKLAKDSRFAEIGAALSALSPIDSEETFNRYCREACRLWTSHFRDRVGETSARFPELLEKIERRSEGVIKTD